jgi:hypothetical protein
MKKIIRLTESDLKEIVNKILNESVEDLYSKMQSHSDDIYNTHKRDIDNYHYIKDKIKEWEIRNNPIFTLSIIKNRDSPPSLQAKVKWGLPFKNKGVKSWISVFIGSTKEFPLGLNTPNLKEIVKERIKEYFEKNMPFEYENPR